MVCDCQVILLNEDVMMMWWWWLPTTVRNVSISLTSFSGRLKAELFRRAYGTDLVPMRQLSAVNSLREHKFSFFLTYL